MNTAKSRKATETLCKIAKAVYKIHVPENRFFDRKDCEKSLKAYTSCFPEYYSDTTQNDIEYAARHGEREYIKEVNNL